MKIDKLNIAIMKASNVGFTISPDPTNPERHFAFFEGRLWYHGIEHPSNIIMMWADTQTFEGK